MTCYTDTYVRVGENWLCILAQLTPVAAENYPPDDTIVVKYLRGVLQGGNDAIDWSVLLLFL
jgi:hypothetical protein